MNTQVLLEELKVLKNKSHELNKQLLTFVQNKDNPLNDRWEVYLNLDLATSPSWTGGSVIENPYEDLYMEKTSTHHASDIVDIAYEESKSKDSHVSYTEEDINNLKEELMQSGYSNFTYDW